MFTAALVTYLIHSTVLGLAAWGIARLLRQRNLAALETVWKVALIGALFTTALQLTMGGSPVGSVATLEAEPLTSLVLGASGVSDPAPAKSVANTSDTPGLASAVGLFFLIAWASIALLLLARFAFRTLVLHRRLRDRIPITDPQLDELLASSGLRRRVRLSTHRAIEAPIALGGIRPEICLPERAVQLEDRERANMLAHELAHIVRWDPAWLTLAHVVEALFFFQPLHILARRRLQEASEYLCDEWAVSRTQQHLSMARCLTEVATWVTPRAHEVPLVPGMAQRPSQLRLRVERLLEKPAPRRGLLAIAALTFALLFGAAMVPGLTSVVPEPQTEPVRKAVSEKPLTKEVTREPKATAPLTTRIQEPKTARTGLGGLGTTGRRGTVSLSPSPSPTSIAVTPDLEIRRVHPIGDWCKGVIDIDVAGLGRTPRVMINNHSVDIRQRHGSIQVRVPRQYIPGKVTIHVTRDDGARTAKQVYLPAQVGCGARKADGFRKARPFATEAPPPAPRTTPPTGKFKEKRRPTY